jgi:aminoglycoside phosphotransferase (APT) family kinase protein
MLVDLDDLAQPLLDDLRARLACPGLGWAEPPQQVHGGAENLTLALRLAGAPPSLSGPLILRRHRPDRDPSAVRFESAVHGAITDLGYPAPRVLLACCDPAPLGGAYLVMERVPGRVLLGEITRLDEVFSSARSTLRHLPRMVGEALFRVPRELARWQARLHALDAKPVIGAVERAGFAADAFSARARLDDLEQLAEQAALDGLRAAIEWLRAGWREPREVVACHADFHFLNMLVESGRVTGVIDWSRQHLCFEAREFDVGNTRALLDISLPAIPGPVRALLGAVQQRMLRRYTALYQREQQRPLDHERVRWAEVFRYVREMVGAGVALRGGAQPSETLLAESQNPWLVPEIRAGVLAGIERRSGVRASLPEPETPA